MAEIGRRDNVKLSAAFIMAQSSSSKGKSKGSLEDSGNGLVENRRRYMLSNDAGSPILLRNWRGRTYTDASTPSWKAIKATKHEDGFQVLCQGEGKREGKFSWMNVNGDGRINGQSTWRPANDPSAQQWEQMFGDVILPDG